MTPMHAAIANGPCLISISWKRRYTSGPRLVKPRGSKNPRGGKTPMSPATPAADFFVAAATFFFGVFFTIRFGALAANEANAEQQRAKSSNERRFAMDGRL